MREKVKENSLLPFYSFAQCVKHGDEILNEYPRMKTLVYIGDLCVGELDKCFITRAKGGSLLPFFESGDNILVNCKPNNIINDDLLLINNINELAIGKVKNIDGIMYLVLLYNKEIYVEKLTSDLEIIGTIYKI